MATIMMDIHCVLNFQGEVGICQEEVLEVVLVMMVEVEEEVDPLQEELNIECWYQVKIKFLMKLHPCRYSTLLFL